MLQSLFNLIRGVRDESIYDTVDRLNAEAMGGSPTKESRHIGDLDVPSQSLVLQDPQYMPKGIVVRNTASRRGRIFLDLLRYPNGDTSVRSLNIQFADSSPAESQNEFGKIGIDSAIVVVADHDAAITNWTDTGVDRIGLIKVVRDQELHRRLKKRFRLKTQPFDWCQVRIVNPVTEQLENEIIQYLESIPEYADFTFMHFCVRTNNSFERVNFMEPSWDFLPVGNQPQPLMFACSTGRGDGECTVQGRTVNGQVNSVSIQFIADEED